MFRKFRQIIQLFSFKDLRNALLGIGVVFGGLGLAFLTLYAYRVNNPKLAEFSAIASLVFVFIIIIFIIPPLARNASAEASQLNLPFEFTTGGAIFIGLLVIVAFSAWNTGNNLLFLVLSFISSAMVVGFFIGNFCLKKLDVKMRFPETIFADEPTPILVSLHNRKKIFPSFSITSEVRGKNRTKSVIFQDLKKILPEKWAERFSRPPVVKHTLDYFVHVPRKDFIENKVEHIFQNRGRFIIKDFELSTKFPFAFFRHRRRLPAQRAEIIIFPKLEELETDLFEMPINAGKLTSRKRGMGQDLLTLRDYQPMDDLRHIDWKATARSSRLTVREYAAEDEKRIMVIFDTRLVKSKKERSRSLREKLEEEQKGEIKSESAQRFEFAVSKAASILSHFAREKAEIQLVTDNQEDEFEKGKDILNQCLKRLAFIEPNYVNKLSNDYLDEQFGEAFHNILESHLFFVTSMDKQQIPTEILHMAKIITY
jgi:uncharacterized protein (DUF58 family)